MTATHPTAVVADGAKVGPDVEIGPYCVVGPRVKIGRGTRLLAHVVVDGCTTIGQHNTIYPFAAVGTAPQDLKYKGEDAELHIGDHNVIREAATINIGTGFGGGVTSIGSHGLFMATSHIAHDCRIGDHVIVSNTALVAGHVRIDDHAILSGGVLVHHFVSIGESAYIAGGTRVNFDVPPYMIAHGIRQTITAVNAVGLKRRGFDDDAISALKDAHRILWRSKLIRRDALAKVEEKHADVPQVRKLVAALRASAKGRNGRALEAHRKIAAVEDDTAVLRGE